MRDMLALIYDEVEEAGNPLPPALKTKIEQRVRARWPGEKVYIAATDPHRAQRIVEDARRLPTGVVAIRHGVTQSYVRRLVKKRPTRPNS